MPRSRATASPLRDPIASRQLELAGAQRRFVRVRFDRPRRSPPRAWVCAFEIAGLGGRKRYRAFGADGVQALLLAIELARLTLKNGGVRIHGAWADESGGFPRYVPSLFGRGFAEHLGRLIDGEVERVARGAIRSGGRRPKPRQGRLRSGDPLAAAQPAHAAVGRPAAPAPVHR
jgi:hypothetical protein